MNSIDLALYADTLAGEAAALAARIERERGRLRQAAVERRARDALPDVVVERLDELGLLATRGDVTTLADLEEALDAVEALQAWVEEQLVGATV
jgi:glycine cleavage system pyridoxal-binding protein P